jgi:hypothetical protein
VTYTQNIDIIYDESMLEVAGDNAMILERIKNRQYCVLLKTQSDSPYGKEMATYYIDGRCYFVRLDNGVATDVHFDWAPKTIGECINQIDVVYDDLEIEFSTFAQFEGLSDWGEATIKVVDGDLYYCNILCESAIYRKNVDIQYHVVGFETYIPGVRVQYNNGIISGTNEQQDILKVFNTIQIYKYCYEIRFAVDDHIYTVYLYYINGTCYIVEGSVNPVLSILYAEIGDKA